MNKVGGQAVLGRQICLATPWLTERHGYDPTSTANVRHLSLHSELVKAVEEGKFTKSEAKRS